MPDFMFPAIPEMNVIPEWRRGHFDLGDKAVHVLDYLAGKDDFGWSDGLTDFHESEAGENHFIDQASRSDALRELHRYVKKSDAVILEIGCSSGFMLDAIRKEFPGAFVMGADIVREPLEKLSLKMPTVPLMRFDLTKCPLPDASVDAIVMLNVLEHIEDDVKAMEQVQRILKPGGVAVIEVPAGPHLYDIYDQMLLHFRRYTSSMLATLATKAGLMVKRSSHLAFFIYPGFFAVKKLNRNRFANASADVMQKQVAGNIRNTRNNPVLSGLMKLELLLGKYIRYPAGIRCLMTCEKQK